MKMSLVTILNYLRNQLLDNPHLEQKISEIAIKIEEHDRQLAIQQVLERDIQRAELELHNLECLHIQIAEDEEEVKANARNILEMYSSFLELNREIENLDLPNLYECKLKLVRANIQEEIREMDKEQEFETRMNDMMENRGIVKLLCERQKKMNIAEMNLNLAKSAAKSKKEDCMTKIYAANETLKSEIIKLATAAKKLQQLQMNSQVYVESSKKLEVGTLSKQNFNFPTPQKFYRFFSEYQKKAMAKGDNEGKEIVENANQNELFIRPILSKSQRPEESNERDGDLLNSKHVTFLLQETSNENKSNELVDELNEFLSDTDEERNTNNAVSYEDGSTSTPTGKNDVEEDNAENNLTTSLPNVENEKSPEQEDANALNNNDDTNIPIVEILDSDLNETKSTADVGTNNKRAKKVEILEQSIIKPAATTSSKMLPTELSSDDREVCLTTSDDSIKDGKNSLTDQFNTMLAGFMDMESPTNKQLTTHNTFANLFVGDSADFTNENQMFGMTDTENSFDLMDSDTADNADEKRRKRHSFDFL